MARLLTITDNTIQDCTKTPLLGGAGREARCVLDDAAQAVAAGVLIQGHNGHAKPDAGDAAWFTVLSGAAAQKEIIDIVLPRWIRGGAAIAGMIAVQGVQ